MYPTSRSTPLMVAQTISCFPRARPRSEENKCPVVGHLRRWNLGLGVMMSAASESVGVGACLDDGAVEGQPARIVGSRSRRQAWSMAEFAASSVRPRRRRRSAEVLAEHLVACRNAGGPIPCLRTSFLIERPSTRASRRIRSNNSTQECIHSQGGARTTSRPGLLERFYARRAPVSRSSRGPSW